VFALQLQWILAHHGLQWLQQAAGMAAGTGS